MKAGFITLLLFVVSLASHAQKTMPVNVDGPSQLNFVQEADAARKIAREDIKNKKVFLLLQGGFAPTVKKTDKAFEKKYGVRLRDFGCVAPNQKFVTAYNTEMFHYLTKTFGAKWRNECRKDVIGLVEYQKTITGKPK